MKKKTPWSALTADKRTGCEGEGHDGWAHLRKESLSDESLFSRSLSHVPCLFVCCCSFTCSDQRSHGWVLLGSSALSVYVQMDRLPFCSLSRSLLTPDRPGSLNA
jgi:hypothetical protein